MSYIVQKAIEPTNLSAKQYEKFMARLAAGEYGLQPKVDGCHIVLVFTNRKFLHALSSTGELVKSCDHLAELIYPDNLPSSDTWAVLGEAYVPNASFQESSGAFRRQYPQRQIMLAAFDLVQVKGVNTLYCPEPYATRANRLGQVTWHTLPWMPVTTKEGAESYARYLVSPPSARPHDGAVLRDLSAPYVAKRCRDAEVVKVKPLLSFDCEVVGMDLAHGTKTGKNTGALVVRFIDGQHLRVATGMTQEQIDSLHLRPEYWLGKIVQVDGLALTEDGLLREPRFVGVRHDKDKPDF